MSLEVIPFESLPDFLTHKELCQYLRIGNNRAYELAQQPDFPKIPFGNRYVFPKAQVKEWMERQIESRISSLEKKLAKVRKAGF